MKATSRILASALILAAPAAFAQSATITASAYVQSAMTLTAGTAASGTVSNSTSALVFGGIMTGTAGAVTINPQTGARTSTGPVLFVRTGLAHGPAGLLVSGANGATYAITVPTSAVTLTSGGNTMTADTFTVSTITGGTSAAPVAANASPTGTLSGSGAQNFNVGANLNVAAAQAPGTYSGTFSVSVAYN